MAPLQKHHPRAKTASFLTMFAGEEHPAKAKDDNSIYYYSFHIQV
jgi:hypothetical protein